MGVSLSCHIGKYFFYVTKTLREDRRLAGRKYVAHATHRRRRIRLSRILFLIKERMNENFIRISWL